MTFESYPKSTSMREPNYEQSEKYSIANDDYTVFSVIPLGLRNTPLRITRFTLGLFCFEDSFIGIVDGKPMKFVNEEEYLEYIPFFFYFLLQ